jgi:hypothetical protein
VAAVEAEGQATPLADRALISDELATLVVRGMLAP